MGPGYGAGVGPKWGPGGGRVGAGWGPGGDRVGAGWGPGGDGVGTGWEQDREAMTGRLTGVRALLRQGASRLYRNQQGKGVQPACTCL